MSGGSAFSQLMRGSTPTQGGAGYSAPAPSTPYQPATQQRTISPLVQQQMMRQQQPMFNPMQQQMMRPQQPMFNPMQQQTSGLQAAMMQMMARQNQPMMRPQMQPMPQYQNRALQYRPDLSQAQASLNRVQPSVYKTDLDAAKARIAELEAASAPQQSYDYGYSGG